MLIKIKARIRQLFACQQINYKRIRVCMENNKLQVSQLICLFSYIVVCVPHIIIT